MTAPAGKVWHARMGPGLDVALCGERGLFIFAPAASRITCATCAEKRAANVSRAKGTSNWRGRWSGRR